MTGPLIQMTIGKANPNRANGVNAVVHGLAGALQARGAKVEVWGITPTPAAPTTARSYPLHLFKRKAHRLGLDAKLVQAIDALPGSAIVHFHGGLLPEYFLIARELKRRQLTWVLSPHGAYAEGALAKGALKKRLYIRLFERFVIRHALRIHSLALGSAGGLREEISSPQLVVIPNGSEAPREPFAELSVSPFCFCYCGRIDEQTKGLDLLGRALRLVLRERPEVRLDMIGDGPDLDRVQADFEALGLANNVTWHGARFGDEKRALLLAASCFVLTSRHEGFPMSLSEAAAMGLPLLVTEGTNFGAYVREWECGVVAAETTEQAIATSMLSLVGTPSEELCKMGREARRLIREELSWDRIAERMLRQLYGVTPGVSE